MANTPHGYPYPIGTDRVMDGDDAIHSLATAVDSKAGVHASGTVTLPAPGTIGTATTVNVTFPVGLFSAPPNVVAAVVNVTPSAFFAATAGNVTAAGCTIAGARNNAPGSTIVTAWHAHQP